MRSASNVIAEGGGAEEAAWLLGHKDSTVTRHVYVEEIKSAERSSKRRSKLEARMGSTLSALGSLHGRATTDEDRSEPTPETGKVVALKPKHAATV